MPQCLMCSTNQSIRIHHEYPMTVLLKVVDNSMTALLDSLSVLLKEGRFLATGKEVRHGPALYGYIKFTISKTESYLFQCLKTYNISTHPINAHLIQ